MTTETIPPEDQIRCLVIRCRQCGHPTGASWLGAKSKISSEFRDEMVIGALERGNSVAIETGTVTLGLCVCKQPES